MVAGINFFMTLFNIICPKLFPLSTCSATAVPGGGPGSLGAEGVAIESSGSPKTRLAFAYKSPPDLNLLETELTDVPKESLAFKDTFGFPPSTVAYALSMPMPGL